MDYMDPDIVAFTAYLVLAVGSGLCVLLYPHLARAVRGDIPPRWRGRPGPAGRMNIPFFTAAAVFIVLEAGVLLILPCALAFRWAANGGFGLYAAGHILFFSLLLAVSLLFACASGALDWER